MKRLLLALVLLALLASPVLADIDPQWLTAFMVEHGYAPQDDPNLLMQGFTGEQALDEHLRALAWSLALGHTPCVQEWEARWCREHACWRLRHTEYVQVYCQTHRVIGGECAFYDCQWF